MTQHGIRIALIPAYKPEERFLDTVQEARRAGLEVVAVDDGSGGDFAQLFQEASVEAAVLPHAVNRGKGSARKTGLSYILETYGGAYTVVTIDADGQHQIEDAIRCCEAAEGSPDTLVLGNRGFISSAGRGSEPVSSPKPT